MTMFTEMDRAELATLARQIEGATHLGFHKGNYGLKHYASDHQRRLILAAVKAALNVGEAAPVKPCPWCGAVHTGGCGRLISGGQSD